MIARVRSAYLRDELKYDRWGALGKILATIEVFQREGVRMEGKKLERYVNIAFPRTFSCQRIPVPGDPVPPASALRTERGAIEEEFLREGVEGGRARALATAEVAERRCLDAGFLKNYLR